MNPNIESLISDLGTLTSFSLKAGALEEVVKDAEKRLRIDYPPQLRAWLLGHDGMDTTFGYLYGASVDGGIELVAALLDGEFPNFRAKQWLPIGGDGCGNHYVVPYDSDDTPVLYVATTACHDEAAYVVASDFDHFLTFLLEHEIRFRRGEMGAFTPEWPFDEAFVRQRDPEISRFGTVLLPWECKDRKRSKSAVVVRGRRRTSKSSSTNEPISEEVFEAMRELTRQLQFRITRKTSKAAFRRAEKHAGFVMPDELKMWLLQCNGVALQSGGFLGVEICDIDGLNMEDVLSFQFTDFGRQGLWPVATDGHGRYFVLPATEEVRPVLCFDVEISTTIPQYVAAPSLNQFLKSYIDSEFAKLRQV
jgi:hypothetical protein